MNDLNTLSLDELAAWVAAAQRSFPGDTPVLLGEPNATWADGEPLGSTFRLQLNEPQSAHAEGQQVLVLLLDTDAESYCLS